MHCDDQKERLCLGLHHCMPHFIKGSHFQHLLIDCKNWPLASWSAITVNCSLKESRVARKTIFIKT